jgi:hypothetical protein
MSDSNFTNGNFLDTNKKNCSFRNSIAVNNVGTEEQQNPREISNKLVILRHCTKKDIIQAKGAKNLIDLSASNLDYVISLSKKCSSEHGTPLSAFAVPHGNAVLNSTVIHTIAKY